MRDTDSEFARTAKVIGCGRGFDLFEHLAVSPDGIGTGEVSAILGVASTKGR